MDKSYSKILLKVNKLQDFIYLFEGRILLLPVEGTVLSSSLGIALDVPDMHVDSMGGRYISHRSNSVFVQCETTIISDTEISVVVGYYYDLIKIFKDGKVCPGYSIVDQYIIQFVNTLDYIKMYTWGDYLMVLLSDYTLKIVNIDTLEDIDANEVFCMNSDNCTVYGKTSGSYI